MQQLREKRTSNPKDKNASFRRRDTKRKCEDENKNKAKVLADDAPCPIHINAKHTWGECFKNKDRVGGSPPIKKTRTSSKKNENKDNVQSTNVAQQPTEPSPINDGHLAQAINESIFQEDSTFMNDDFIVTLSFSNESHHLDYMSFPVEQVNTAMFDIDLEGYTSFYDNMFSLGDDEINLLENNDSDDILNTLGLRSVGIMLARTIQGQSNAQPLKVLFDSGSDKVLINRRVLPKGAVPKKVQQQKFTGIQPGAATFSQAVLLEDISFPEFSATQRVDKPMIATVFNNSESVYDIILGMDAMQALGFDVLNTSKVVTWNGKQIPFRPSDESFPFLAPQIL